LAKHEVKYLVVGGYAVMKYAEPRFTKDLDLFIAADPDNAKRVFDALSEFGAPLKGLRESDFEKEGFFYQMGRPPLRIDILMSVDGISFEEAWPNREAIEVAGVVINFIGKVELIRSKLAVGRPQDLIDVDQLEALDD
jgi:hypothetical protein